jgi:hypothetical protein
MILHTYDPTLDIVKDFDTGVKKSLENEIEPVVETYYMNLLTKKTITEKNQAGAAAKKAIDHFKPKIIISVGDEAQEYAAKFYIGQKKIKVIFSGLIGDFKKYGYIPGKNVGGVIAVPPVDEINIFLNSIFPDIKNVRLSHLGDSTTIVELTEKMLKEHQWKNVEFIDSLKVDDFTNFKKAVKDLNNRSDIILVSSYRGLHFEKDEKEFLSDEIMHWLVNNTTIPIISTLGYAVEEGAGAVIVSSSYEQGRLTMEAALNVIKHMDTLPNISTNTFAVFLNEDHLKKYNLIMPHIYRSFAESIEKFYGHHKKLLNKKN